MAQTFLPRHGSQTPSGTRTHRRRAGRYRRYGSPSALSPVPATYCSAPRPALRSVWRHPGDCALCQSHTGQLFHNLRRLPHRDTVNVMKDVCRRFHSRPHPVSGCALPARRNIRMPAPHHFPTLFTSPHFHCVKMRLGNQRGRNVGGGNNLPANFAQRSAAARTIGGGHRYHYRFLLLCLLRLSPEPAISLSRLPPRRLRISTCACIWTTEPPNCVSSTAQYQSEVARSADAAQ